MLPKTSIKNIQNIYNEFPKQFWTLITASFIDRLGGALLFPFFTLYVTEKFGVGMTQIGLLFGVFSVSAMIGGMLGGVLTDRFGRKITLILGLVASALSSVVMGLINTLDVFIIFAMVSGIFSEVGGPAHQAMVADLLPDKQRAQGFGIFRVVFNLAVAIGPAIGGLLASKSYLLLFICDAITSLITAIIVAISMHETKPEESGETKHESIGQTFRGYVEVLHDSTFMAFIAVGILMVLVYVQMNSTLPVYLRDFHGINARGFGYILSLNAGMVVLFQFYITRKIKDLSPMPMMAIGCVLYAIGFSMYGFFASYTAFLIAMVIITIGEMIVSPVSQALVAYLSPENMRGRYMALSGFNWMIGFAIGPLLAGLVIDYIDARWVWYGAGIIGLITAASYLLLQNKVASRQASKGEAPAEPVSPDT